MILGHWQVGDYVCPSIWVLYGWCEISTQVSFTWWPLALPGWSRPPSSIFLGSLDNGVQKACRTWSLLLTLLPWPPFPFDLSLLQSMTAAPESVVDEYMTKYHQDCYSMCAEPFPRAGLPVYLDTVMCAVFALLPLPYPFFVFLGFFCLGLVWFYSTFCVPNMRFSLLVLFNCGVEASICVIFGGWKEHC